MARPRSAGEVSRFVCTVLIILIGDIGWLLYIKDTKYIRLDNFSYFNENMQKLYPIGIFIVFSFAGYIVFYVADYPQPNEAVEKLLDATERENAGIR